MDNWYIVTAWTGGEHSCAANIKRYNVEKSIGGIKPFVPTRETFFERHRHVKTETSVLFPGYVFVETKMEAQDFRAYVGELRRRFRNSMMELRYGDSDELAVPWEEKLPLMKLMNHEWVVKTSAGFKENGVVTVTSGPLVGHEGQIKKIDRHKMTAWLEIEMHGRKYEAMLGLQLLLVGNSGRIVNV